jgi:hypothetical protein
MAAVNHVFVVQYGTRVQGSVFRTLEAAYHEAAGLSNQYGCRLIIETAAAATAEWNRRQNDDNGIEDVYILVASHRYSLDNVIISKCTVV